MSNLEEFQRRIQGKLAVSEERLHLRQNHLQQQMSEIEERARLYNATADRVMENIIRPRMEHVTTQLPGVELLQDSNTRHTCCLGSPHTERFPATTRVELGVTRDGEYKTFCVQYRLEILPIFFPFEGRDEIRFPVDAVDEKKVAAWVEDKLVGFVDAYLRLETDHHYQDENQTTDPVCGMLVNKAHPAAQAEYRGKTYYFCIAECRQRFLAAPERYLSPTGSGDR
jgi:YHS domain-containing protein